MSDDSTRYLPLCVTPHHFHLFTIVDPPPRICHDCGYTERQRDYDGPYLPGKQCDVAFLRKYLHGNDPTWPPVP